MVENGSCGHGVETRRTAPGLTPPRAGWVTVGCQGGEADVAGPGSTLPWILAKLLVMMARPPRWRGSSAACSRLEPSP